MVYTALGTKFNNAEKGKQIKIIPYKYLLANEFNQIEVEDGKSKNIYRKMKDISENVQGILAEAVKLFVFHGE